MVFGREHQDVVCSPGCKVHTLRRSFACLFWFNVAFTNVFLITMVSAWDRELNGHFYNAASPDT